MKKILFVILTVFLMPDAFPQSNVNEGVNFRFENRKKEGYYNITQISMMMGNHTTTEQRYPYQTSARVDLKFSPSVTMTNGILGEHWARGIGVGFEIFNHNLFPVFVDLRYNKNDNDISHFFALKAGYAFGTLIKKHYTNLSLDYEPFYVSDVDFINYGGLMLNPELGVKIPLSEKVDVLFTVGYRHQRLRTKIFNNYGGMTFETEHKENLNKLSFGMAFMFR